MTTWSFSIEPFLKIAYCSGLTLMHSIWQGAIIVVMFLLALFLLRKQKLSIQYNIGFLSLCLFITCFAATFLYTYNQLDAYDNPFKIAEPVTIKSEHTTNMGGGILVEPLTGQTDTGLLLRKDIFNICVYLISTIWLLCFLCIIIFKATAYFKLKRLKENPLNTSSGKWQNILDEMAHTLRIKKHIRLLVSPIISSVATFGFIKPVVIFPLKMFSGLSEDEIKSILAHELAHIMRNDYLFNLFQTIIDSFFFYHPGVRFISQMIRKQREMICDEIAVDYCDNKKLYINALVNIEELQLNEVDLALSASNNSNELLSRIKYLLNDNKQKQSNRAFPIALLISLILLITSSAFILSKTNKTLKDTTFQEIVGKKLQTYNGSLVLYDLKQNEYYFYNKKKSTTQFPAYSTFKITSSLMALESGIANDINYAIKYDSLKYPLEPWMKNDGWYKFWLQDNNMKSAFRYSVNWFYLELNERIGYKRIANYLNEIDYWNDVEPENISTSWLNGTLQTTATEQVDFLTNLYNNNLKGFTDESQDITKEIMLNEARSNYKLFAKTGTGEVDNDEIIGWYVGFIETNNNTYVFAFNMFASNYNTIYKSNRKKVILDVFNELGLI